MSVTASLSLSRLGRDLESLGLDPAALDYSRGLRAASVYLAAQSKLCFAESRTPDGTPWPPFKRTPSRRRGGRSAKLLIDKGILAASMSAAAAGARGAVRDLTRVSLEQGTNIDYAGWQNFGTRTIPAREFVGITPAHAARIEELIADDVVRQMGF